VRMLSLRRAEEAMMFSVCPACMLPTVTTAASLGSTSEKEVSTFCVNTRNRPQHA